MPGIEAIIETPEGVFLSYSTRDRAAALDVKRELERRGVGVRIDCEAVVAGEQLRDFILRSIRSTVATVLIVSEKSLLSDWVAIEVALSLSSSELSQRRFFACYVDDAFLDLAYGERAVRQIDDQLSRVDLLILEAISSKRDPVDLNPEKTRLTALRHGLGPLLGRLRSSLCLDVRSASLTESIEKLTAAVLPLMPGRVVAPLRDASNVEQRPTEIRQPLESLGQIPTGLSLRRGNDTLDDHSPKRQSAEPKTRGHSGINTAPPGALSVKPSGRPPAQSRAWIGAAVLAIGTATLIPALRRHLSRDGDVQLQFVDSTGEPVSLVGTVSLRVGDVAIPRLIQDAAGTSLSPVRESDIGKPYGLTLETKPRYTWKRTRGLATLSRSMIIEVYPDPAYFFAGTVRRAASGQSFPKVSLAIDGTSCTAVSGDNGFFQFSFCPAAESVRKQALIQLPSSERCKNLVPLIDPPARTDVQIGEDCSSQVASLEAPSDPRAHAASASPSANSSTPPCDFRCRDDSCIAESQVCDRVQDCPKGEDEQQCGPKRPTTETQLPFAHEKSDGTPSTGTLRYCLVNARLLGAGHPASIQLNDGTVYRAEKDLGSKYTQVFVGDRDQLLPTLKRELLEKDYDVISGLVNPSVQTAELDFVPCGITEPDE